MLQIISTPMGSHSLQVRHPACCREAPGSPGPELVPREGGWVDGPFYGHVAQREFDRKRHACLKCRSADASSRIQGIRQVSEEAAAQRMRGQKVGGGWAALAAVGKHCVVPSRAGPGRRTRSLSYAPPTCHFPLMLHDDPCMLAACYLMVCSDDRTERSSERVKLWPFRPSPRFSRSNLKSVAFSVVHTGFRPIIIIFS